jgi:hypothetical protein
VAAPKFEVIEEPDIAPEPESGLAFNGLMLALKALSQRAIVALEACFTLVTVGLVFVLYYVTPDPNFNQIVSLATFSTFVLLANVIVVLRRRR